ncbi:MULTISPECIES: hypothetical protein [Vagococcus]|uniref:hypothetical protein n=1 Tax=Vagococcus TaxID=2737 RepID=UPI000E4D25EE|nr:MULTISPECIES: hypothetical protein [Vagococcus]RHH67531.1 hypothetical protein DW196_09435 [Vagococcus sp. AM17-17]
MKIFTVKDLEQQSQSVKTTDNYTWINMTDGRFMRYDTSTSQEPICESSIQIYERVKTVMYNNQIIAKKHPKERLPKWQVNKQLA